MITIINQTDQRFIIRGFDIEEITRPLLTYEGMKLFEQSQLFIIIGKDGLKAKILKQRFDVHRYGNLTNKVVTNTTLIDVINQYINSI